MMMVRERKVVHIYGTFPISTFTTFFIYSQDILDKCQIWLYRKKHYSKCLLLIIEKIVPNLNESGCF